jgi:hypothetical protein
VTTGPTPVAFVKLRVYGTTVPAAAVYVCDQVTSAAEGSVMGAPWIVRLMAVTPDWSVQLRAMVLALTGVGVPRTGIVGTTPAAAAGVVILRMVSASVARSRFRMPTRK